MHTDIAINNGKAVVRLRGRFDFSAHREFREGCNSCLGVAEVNEIRLDMSGVDYLDSSALGMLLMLKERADTAAKRIVISDCRAAVKQVLEIANFGRLFSIA